MAADKVKFSIKNVHIAPMLTSGANPTWDTPIAVPGAVSLSLAPQGDVTPFYADGIVYYQSSANNGYSGDLVMALFPAEILEALWGITEGKTSKVLTEYANVEAKAFALLFEEDGDQSGTKFVLYNCTATRPNRTFNTNTETKEPQTQTITVTAAPLENYMVMAMTQDTTPAETVNGWFTDVFVEGSQT